MYRKRSIFSSSETEIRIHRTPPLASDGIRGICNWCGGPTKGKKKWHMNCMFKGYNIATNYKGALRRVIRARDKGICSITGEFDKLWQADHIRPLFLVDRGLPVRIVQLYFLPDNIQTLSTVVHREKTKRENAFIKRGVNLPIIRDPIRDGLISGNIPVPTMISYDGMMEVENWLKG